MQEKKLKKLLKQRENSLLDFKEKFYDYTSKNSKIDFVKDVLAFANSTILNSGYIICGVNNEGEIIGIEDSLDIDEANWVQIIKSYASHPINFGFYKLFLIEKSYSVIVIEIFKSQTRPIICTKEYGGKLQRGVIYFRNGPVNDIATDLVTIEKIIGKFSENEDLIHDPTYSQYSKFPHPPYYKFFGRQNEIKKIYDKLINHHKNYVVSLIGEGGVGKTSIAYKIAKELKITIDKKNNLFDEVIWISAKDQRIYFDEKREIKREFVSIFDLINKILLLFYDTQYVSKLSKSKKIELMNQALEGCGYFFVLDNIEVFSQEQLEEINNFIQNAPLGHKFLLTSRHDLRVQEFIKVENFDKEITRDYINDVADAYELEEKDKAITIEQFEKFYSLTNGNPLYIKFFIAQIKRGRALKTILDRKDIESEKSIKGYCFDSTINVLDGNELKVIYSFAISNGNYISSNEIRFISCMEKETLNIILGNLTSLSLIMKESKAGENTYSMNGLLKDYLIEENRMPVAEYLNLKNRANKLKLVSIPVREDYSYNFGLMSLNDSVEISSYNLTLESINNNSISQSLLDEIRILHPGNYLIHLYKHFIRIQEDNNNIYNLYNDINADFVSITDQIKNKEEKIMMHVWKSFLYIMIGKYEDVIIELEMCEDFNNNDYESLVYMLKGTTYHMLAYEEYHRQQFKKHDEYRNIAGELFSNWIYDFIEKPFFHFIKRNIIIAYNNHMHHQKNEEKRIIFQTYAADIPIFKNVSIYR